MRASERITCPVKHGDAELCAEALVTPSDDGTLEVEVVALVTEPDGWPYSMAVLAADDYEAIVDQVQEAYEEGLFRLED